VACEIQEGKDDKNCTRIIYPGNAGTNTASLELIKLMLNRVISRKGVQLVGIDIKNFYLDTPMVDPEYVQIKITFPKSLSWNTS
jgi:hypothetical protein